MDTVAKDPAKLQGIHKMAIVTRPDMVPLDLVVPLQVFGPWPPHMQQNPRLHNPYRVTLAGETQAACGPWLVTRQVKSLKHLQSADTVVVPGVMNPLLPVNPALLQALRQAHDRGARMVSICTGSFALAAAGILDGRSATTHWHWASALRQMSPTTRVREAELYVTDKAVATSAGVLAGTDLCLHLLRADCGQEAANAMARFLVSPPHREGGQAQFIDLPHDPDDNQLTHTMDWMLSNIREPLTLESIALHAHLSARTLRRRFAATTGTSVLAWLAVKRVDRARELLETTDLSVDEIAEHCGFGSTESLRLHFLKQVHTSPTRYRRTFGSPPPNGVYDATLTKDAPPAA